MSNTFFANVAASMPHRLSSWSAAAMSSRAPPLDEVTIGLPALRASATV